MPYFYFLPNYMNAHFLIGAEYKWGSHLKHHELCLRSCLLCLSSKGKCLNKGTCLAQAPRVLSSPLTTMVWELFPALHKVNLRKMFSCVLVSLSFMTLCGVFHIVQPIIVAKGTFPVGYQKTKMFPKGSFEVKYEILMENGLRCMRTIAESFAFY